MIKVGNQKQKKLNKDKLNHFNHIPMQSLLGAYNRLTLLHMAKSFIWLEETKECINNVSIGYMINTTLNIDKSFKEQLNKCMRNIFGTIIQPDIRSIQATNNTRVLA